MNYEQLEKKAFKLGASQFGISNRLIKRFYVIYKIRQFISDQKLVKHTSIIIISTYVKTGLLDIPRYKIQKENT